MAVESDGIVFPESTGVVVTPVDPVTVVQVPGHPVSTGAVDAPPATVSTEFGDLGQDSTGTVPTPGPVTTRNTSVKVVRAPRRAAAEGASTAETTSTGSVRAQQAATDGH